MLDVKAFVVRSLLDGQSKPTSLFFALNVGKAGFKWQCIHCKQITGQCAMLIGKRKIICGDSLAWSIPVDLLPRLEQFKELIYGESLFNYSAFECRTSSKVTNEQEHKCGFSCAS